MMKEYEELLRLKYDHIQIRSKKRYVDSDLAKKFFKSPQLTAEEKIDGSQCAIGWKGGIPYAQGKNSHIPEFDKRVAYDGMWSWIWQNCDKLEKSKGHLIYGEWMKPMHSVYYDNLPSFFMAFDVWRLKDRRYLDTRMKTALLNKWGFSYIRTLFVGKLKMKDVPKLVDDVKSAYSEQNCEGCVLKDYNSGMFVKYVTREFLDMFDDSGHWTGRGTVQYNRLKEWNE